MVAKIQNNAEVCIISNGANETFKILGWCPAGSVLPNGEKVPL